MSQTDPTADDVGLLIEKFALLRNRDYKAPPQILTNLQNEINRVVLPCIEQLDRKSIEFRRSLDDFVKNYVKADKVPLDATRSDFESTKATCETIAKEIDSLNHEIEFLPTRSARRIELAKALGLRSVELDLMSKKLGKYSHAFEMAISRANELIPSVEGTQKGINGLRHSFLKALFGLTWSDIVTRLAKIAPTAFALLTTILFDRATLPAESFLHTWPLGSAHDLVLLSFFAAQVLLLTPLFDKLVRWLCWRTFDRTLELLSSLLPELRSVETRMSVAEGQLNLLYLKMPAEEG